MRYLLTTFLLTSLATVGLVAACTSAGGPKPAETPRASAVEAGERDESEEVEAAAPNTPAEPAEVEAQPAAAKANSAPRGVKIAVVSDLNGRYGSTDYGDEVHAAVQWIVEEVDPDVVLSTGDMVAGQKRGLDYDAMWRGFHAAVTEPLARAGIPLAASPGNHDASAGSVYMPERITYVEQWQRRRPALDYVDDTFFPLHYAFEIGPALFISLDATITGPIDDQQRRWLRGVLEANRDKPTKIVFGHVPLYPFSEERKTEVLADAKLEALLDEYDVDMMLSGHHHAYYPGRRDELRVVSMACLGSGRRTLVGDDERSHKSVAVIEVAPSGKASVEAYRVDDKAKIEREGLPESLNEGEWEIWRDDVVE